MRKCEINSKKADIPENKRFLMLKIHKIERNHYICRLNLT